MWWWRSRRVSGCLTEGTRWQSPPPLGGGAVEDRGSALSGGSQIRPIGRVLPPHRRKNPKNVEHSTNGTQTNWIPFVSWIWIGQKFEVVWAVATGRGQIPAVGLCAFPVASSIPNNPKLCGSDGLVEWSQSPRGSGISRSDSCSQLPTKGYRLGGGGRILLYLPPFHPSSPGGSWLLMCCLPLILHPLCKWDIKDSSSKREIFLGKFSCSNWKMK